MYNMLLFQWRDPHLIRNQCVFKLPFGSHFYVWLSDLNFCNSLDLQLSEEAMTGMVDANASDNGNATAMESAGDGFVSDLPNLAPDAPWTMDQEPDTFGALTDQQNPEQGQLEQYQQYSVDGHSQSAMEQKSDLSEQHSTSEYVAGDQPETNGQAVEGHLKETELNSEKQAETGSSDSPANMELEDGSKEESEVGDASASKPSLPTDFERLYKVVEDDPDDFNGWVYLLQYVEQEVSAAYVNPKHRLIKEHVWFNVD